ETRLFVLREWALRLRLQPLPLECQAHQREAETAVVVHVLSCRIEVLPAMHSGQLAEIRAREIDPAGRTPAARGRRLCVRAGQLARERGASRRPERPQQAAARPV